MAVALVAAALADPMVETVANTGIFGGHYADNNHVGVIPALLVGAVLACEIVIMRCLRLLEPSRTTERTRLIAVARSVSTLDGLRDLPFVFAMQIFALFLLESAEQLVLGGKLLGGTSWLGGPIAFSLLAHAVVGATCTFALGACARAVVRAFASFVYSAIRYIWLAMARATGGSFRFGVRNAFRARAQSPHVRQIGGRAPPLLFVPA